MVSWLIESRIGRAITAIGAAVMAFLGVYLAGVRSGKERAKIDDLKAYQDIRKKADEADLSHGDVDNDFDVLRDFHQRNGRN